MSLLIQILIITLIGLIAITLIDSVGAIASRKYDFNYGYLTVLSLLVYATIGGLVSTMHNLSLALAINLLLGFYDATVGWWIAMRLKANTGLPEEELSKMTPAYTLQIMLVMSVLFTLIGHWLSSTTL